MLAGLVWLVSVLVVLLSTEKARGDCVIDVKPCGFKTLNDTVPNRPTFTCLIDSCCTTVRNAINSGGCASDPSFLDFLSTLQSYQSKNCDIFCEDPCLDPIGPTATVGYLNKAFIACGASDPTTLSNASCTSACCLAMSDAYSFCMNGSNTSKLEYRAFDVVLTGYQLFSCPFGYTCYPDDKCLDPLGFINNNRGALNRALASCGVPDLQDFTNINLDGLQIDTTLACNSSCCVAMEDAQHFCINGSDVAREYEIVSAALPIWQALNCEHFTCKPEECFDPYGLINSNIGAANRVLRACGAVSDLETILSFNISSWDLYRACRPECCIAIEEARPFCNSTADASNYEIFVELILAYQAANCPTSVTDPYGGPFLCKPNDQCWDVLGLVNERIGGATRAAHACGFPYSLDNAALIIQNQNTFNISMACEDRCCSAVEAEKPICNSSVVFQALDVTLIGYQLLHCEHGFTCIPENQCFDPLGIINSDRGYFNRALKACGVPDGKTAITDLSTIPTDFELACSDTCCAAMENAALFCNDSTAFSAFENILPLWQAKQCYNFTCAPTSCFQVAGLLNPRLGAVNKILRYCGAPSQITDILTTPLVFDTALLCQNYCCDAIDYAVPYCGNDSDVFNFLLNTIYTEQQVNCRGFMCPPVSSYTKISVLGLGFYETVGLAVGLSLLGLLIIIVVIVFVCKK